MTERCKAKSWKRSRFSEGTSQDFARRGRYIDEVKNEAWQKIRQLY